jgi:DNA-binding response OmpR family regulator
MYAFNSTNNVLLVEDDARLRSVLARTIRQRGHRVIEVESASEACEILEDNRVRAAVIDVNLPDGTGWDVVRWVRTHCDPAPTLIVISAAGFPASRVREYQPDATLSKPFPIEALIQHLERPRAGDANESRRRA